MVKLTVELPEELATELKERRIPDELLHRIVVHAVKQWLCKEGGNLFPAPEAGTEGSSLFSESAIPFVDKLIEENRSLFGRLAETERDSHEFARRIIDHNRELFTELGEL